MHKPDFLLLYENPWSNTRKNVKKYWAKCNFDGQIYCNNINKNVYCGLNFIFAFFKLLATSTSNIIETIKCWIFRPFNICSKSTSLFGLIARCIKVCELLCCEKLEKALHQLQIYPKQMVMYFVFWFQRKKCL